MSAPRISLCMIAKDEAPVLRRCLESVNGAVDEIVLVDTGSSDETVEIAKEFGARVFFHPWQDDFSEARNHSLDHATGDWALWLDADEVLQPGGPEAVRRAVEDPKAAGYSLRFTDMLDEGKQTRYLMPRLFLLRPEIRFVNIIHEQILGAVERYAQAHGLHVKICEAAVHHFGYRASEMQRKGKAGRTERLFRKQLSLYPEDAYSWFKFGDYVRQSNREESVQALHRSLDLILRAAMRGEGVPPFTAEVATLLATEEQALGHSDAAWAAIEAFENLGVARSPNFLFGKACVARLQGRAQLALEHYNACLAEDAKDRLVATQWGIQGPLSWYGIAECKIALGDDEGAMRAYQEAVRLAPQHAEIVLSYAIFLMRQRRALECIEALTDYLAKNPPASPLWESHGEPLLRLALKLAAQGTAARSAPQC